MAWGGKKSGQFTLAEVGPEDCWETMSSIVDAGVLLSFGRSRDGGALSVGYVHNGSKGREWFSDAESFAEGLHDLEKHLGLSSAAPTDGRASQRARKGAT